MSQTVLIKVSGGSELKSQAPVSLLLDVPLSYTSAKLLYEIIKACDLNYLNSAGGAIRYVLQRSEDGEILSPHATFAHLQLLRGENLCLRKAINVLAEASPDFKHIDLTDYEDFEIDNEFQLPEYQKEACLYEACGAYEKAIEVLARRWEECYKRRNVLTVNTLKGSANFNPNNQELEQLRDQIANLMETLVDGQLVVTQFEEFYELLQQSSTKLFFATYPDIRTHFVKRLLLGSRQLAQRQAYQNSRDFAVLARQLDPENEVALSLESLAHQYVTLETTTDVEERHSLAHAIYQIDSSYGTIAEDLRNIVKEARSNLYQTAAAPTSAQIAPSSNVAVMSAPTLTPSATAPVTTFYVENKGYRKPFRLNFIWLMIIFALLLFILMFVWLLTS